MRAILLAAGRGLRLQQSANDARPKCLLDFGGATLLERHLRLLESVGVDAVVIAVGYRAELVEAELDRLQRRADVELVRNPRHDLGSMLTLHTVNAAMTRGDDVLLMDADVLYDARILRPLVDGDGIDRLLVDGDFVAGDEPVKVCRKDGVVVEFAKRVPAGLDYDTIGESVGFFRFRAATASRLAAIVAAHVGNGRGGLPHEQAIRDLLLAHPGDFDVADVTGAPWIEIDFPDDVARATGQVLPRLEPLMAANR